MINNKKGKSNNMMWIVILVIVGFIILNPSILKIFSIFQETDSGFSLTSNYILKVGFTDSIQMSGNDIYSIYTDLGNQVIDKFYAVGIFDNPIVLNNYTRDTLESEMMKANNKGYGTIFSSKLISNVQKNSYDLKDLYDTLNELDNSAIQVCSLIKANCSVLGSFKSDSNCKAIKNICDQKPTKIFAYDTNILSPKLTMNLNDFEVWFDTYQPQANCTPTCFNASYGVQQCIYCASVPVWTKIGTLNLSDIKFLAIEKAGDIIIGIGDKGINEANNIDGRFDFAQYAYQIEHKDALPDSSLDLSQAAYTVVSNNADVVAASNGDIKQKDYFNDLITGITSGEVMKSPSTLILLGGALVGILLLFMLLSKK